MKKIFFLAVMAIVSFSAAAQTTKTSKVLISEFSSREVSENIAAYQAMASSEAGYIYLERTDNKTTGFVSVVSHFDTEMQQNCIRIRAVKGSDMIVISYFGRIRPGDGQADLERYGYKINATDVTVAIETANGSKLVLDAVAAAKGEIQMFGTTAFATTK